MREHRIACPGDIRSGDALATRQKNVSRVDTLSQRTGPSLSHFAKSPIPSVKLYATCLSDEYSIDTRDSFLFSPIKSDTTNRSLRGCNETTRLFDEWKAYRWWRVIDSKRKLGDLVRCLIKLGVDVGRSFYSQKLSTPNDSVYTLIISLLTDATQFLASARRNSLADSG